MQSPASVLGLSAKQIVLRWDQPRFFALVSQKAATQKVVTSVRGEKVGFFGQGRREFPVHECM